jgi:hypothetical protein
MNDHLQNVTNAIRETVFHSPTSFSCLGQRCARLMPRLQHAMTPATARKYLLYQLQSRLYNEFYVRGGAAAPNWSSGTGTADPISFVDVLSRANAGTGCHEPSWTLVRLDATECVLRKDGLTLFVRPDEYRIEDNGVFEASSTVCLLLPKELRSASPGYYLALSNQCDRSTAGPLVRLYWNLKAEGAALFVRAFTNALNEARIFFRLKVLNGPGAYVRCDAGVIYFHKYDYEKMFAAWAQVYEGIEPYLKSAVPMFTRRIAAGVGLAEDPGTQESFGQHRCRLLADGMIRGYEQHAQSLDERLRLVLNRFDAEGIRMTEPYLNANSVDTYSFRKSGRA